MVARNQNPDEPDREEVVEVVVAMTEMGDAEKGDTLMVDYEKITEMERRIDALEQSGEVSNDKIREYKRELQEIRAKALLGEIIELLKRQLEIIEEKQEDGVTYPSEINTMIDLVRKLCDL